MSDAWLAGYLVALCGLGLAWWLTCRWIAARLRRRHAPRAIVVFGTPERRRNSMDQFFALMGFLFQDQSALRDTRLWLACALLKALTVFWLITFVAMMFTPMFLKLGVERG